MATRKADTKPQYVTPDTIINPAVYEFLKRYAKSLQPPDRYIILAFNEYKLSDVTPSSYKLIDEHPPNFIIVCIRFINSNFYQPIGTLFLYNDTFKTGRSPTAKDLADCMRLYIMAVAKTLLKIVSTVTPPTLTFKKALSDLLGVQDMASYADALVYSVGNVRDIVHIYDPPSMLKVFRNMWLHQDIECRINSRCFFASWQHLIQLYRKGELPFLVNEHIVPSNKIEHTSYAATVFSNKVCMAVTQSIKTGMSPENTMGTSILLKIFNDLFDSFNSSENEKSFTRHFITPTSFHASFWNKALRFLETLYFLERAHLRRKIMKTPYNKVPSIKPLGTEMYERELIELDARARGLLNSSLIYSDVKRQITDDPMGDIDIRDWNNQIVPEENGFAEKVKQSDEKLKNQLQKLQCNGKPFNIKNLEGSIRVVSDDFLFDKPRKHNMSESTDSEDPTQDSGTNNSTNLPLKDVGQLDFLGNQAQVSSLDFAHLDLSKFKKVDDSMLNGDLTEPRKHCNKFKMRPNLANHLKGHQQYDLKRDTVPKVIVQNASEKSAKTASALPQKECCGVQETALNDLNSTRNTRDYNAKNFVEEDSNKERNEEVDMKKFMAEFAKCDVRDCYGFFEDNPLTADQSSYHRNIEYQGSTRSTSDFSCQTSCTEDDCNCELLFEGGAENKTCKKSCPESYCNCQAVISSYDLENRGKGLESGQKRLKKRAMKSNRKKLKNVTSERPEMKTYGLQVDLGGQNGSCRKSNRSLNETNTLINNRENRNLVNERLDEEVPLNNTSYKEKVVTKELIKKLNVFTENNTQSIKNKEKNMHKTISISNSEKTDLSDTSKFSITDEDIYNSENTLALKDINEASKHKEVNKIAEKGCLVLKDKTINIKRDSRSSNEVCQTVKTGNQKSKKKRNKNNQNIQPDKDINVEIDNVNNENTRDQNKDINISAGMINGRILNEESKKFIENNGLVLDSSQSNPIQMNLNDKIINSIPDTSEMFGFESDSETDMPTIPISDIIEKLEGTETKRIERQSFIKHEVTNNWVSSVKGMQIISEKLQSNGFMRINSKAFNVDFIHEYICNVRNSNAGSVEKDDSFQKSSCKMLDDIQAMVAMQNGSTLLIT